MMGNPFRAFKDDNYNGVCHKYVWCHDEAEETRCNFSVPHQSPLSPYVQVIDSFFVGAYSLQSSKIKIARFLH